MNTTIAKQSTDRASYDTPVRRGIPLGVAFEIVPTIVTVGRVEKVLDISESTSDRHRPKFVWATERALQALKEYVHIVPTVFTRQEIIRSRSMWDVFSIAEHFLDGKHDIVPDEFRYRIVVRDLPQEERVKAWQIARNFGLAPRRLGLIAATTTFLIAKRVFGFSLTRQYLTSSVTKDGRYLALGPVTEGGRPTVRPLRHNECHREMVEFV